MSPSKRRFEDIYPVKDYRRFDPRSTVAHRLIKWFIRHVPQLNRLWVWSDDLLRYGRTADLGDYWKQAD